MAIIKNNVSGNFNDAVTAFLVAGESFLKMSLRNLNTFFLGVFFLCYIASKYAQANDNFIIEPYGEPRHLYGYDEELCQDVLNILKLPENKDYIKTWYKQFPRPLFYIPLENTKFKQLGWDNSSIEEFKNALPDKYENLVSYFKNNPDKNYAFYSVKKTMLDLYRDGHMDTLYKAHFGNNEYRIFTDTAKEWLGGEQFFDDEIAGYPMFFYREGGYVLYIRDMKNIYISMPYAISGFYPIIDVCKIKLEKTEQQEQ